MGHYDIDVHCWKCKKYLHSYYPDAKIPPGPEFCDACFAAGAQEEYDEYERKQKAKQRAKNKRHEAKLNRAAELQIAFKKFLGTLNPKKFSESDIPFLLEFLRKDFHTSEKYTETTGILRGRSFYWPRVKEEEAENFINQAEVILRR